MRYGHIPEHFRKDMSAVAMSRNGFHAWLETYNRWAVTWNEHETDRSKPHSPEWSDGYMIGLGGSPRNSIAFVSRATDKIGMFVLVGVHEFEDTGTFGPSIRTVLKPEDVKWAAWVELGSDSEPEVGL